MKRTIPKPLGTLLTLLMLTLLVFARAQVSRGFDVPTSNFSFFWLAGRMLLDGQDPYNESQYLAGHDANKMDWRPNNIFPYPLPLALLCIPLGFFSMQAAYFIWQAFTLVMVALAVHLLLQHWQTNEHRTLFLPTFFFLLFFGPLYLSTHAGTIGILTVIFILAAIMLFEKDHSFWAGAALALTMLKPPQGITILLLSGVWLHARRDWKAMAGVAAGGLGIFIVGLIQDPHWVQKFLGAGDAVLARTQGIHSNVWAFAYLACKGSAPCSTLLGETLSLILLGGASLLLWKNQAKWSAWEALNLIIPIGFVSTIYLWTYDQLPYIIPIVWVMGTLVKKRRGVLLAFGFLILLDIVSIFALVQLTFTGKDLWSLGSTLLVLGATMWLLFHQQRSHADL